MPKDMFDIIRVDRSVLPIYPNWVKEVMHPELGATGPVKYSIDEVEQWLHEDQKNGGQVKGRIIYDYFVGYNMLERCLGLCDLEGIQKKGIAFFRRNFQNKFVYGWKSVARLRDDNLHVPYLFEGGDKMVMCWRRLDKDLGSNDPALRFAS